MKNMLAILLFMVVPAIAMADDVRPEDLVKALYATHSALKQSEPRGVFAAPAALAKFFNADMADRIQATQSAPGIDPLFDSSARAISNLQVNVLTTGYETADVEATFRAAGEKKRLVFSLMREFSTWRIRDISAAESGWTLQDMFPGP